MHPVNRTRLGAALLVVLAVTGCTSTDQPTADAGGPTASRSRPAGGQESTQQRPLVLHGDGGGTCHQASVANLAFFDISWEATTDLDSLKFRLTNAHGVRQLDNSLNVPPVNFGGRIDYSGASAWDQRVQVLNNRFLLWPQHGPLWTWSPIKGETGLPVLHLRVDQRRANSDEGAGFDGVTALYRTADGARGSTAIDDPNIFRRRC